jgi:phosphoribosylformimino-5-aminoimidazole carboxamide ribotide isomerase
MYVIPAIDLKDGQCVRLQQGKKDAVTIYSRDPSTTARKWESYGAKVLHVIDLDGAFTGSQKNLKGILEIRKAVKMVIQVGGGIRDIATVNRLLSAGINRVIIGTSAIEDFGFVIEACNKFPGKIFVGIDAKDGKAAVKGWEEISSIEAKELAKRIENVGISGIIYTDILRDGMLTGPNIPAVEDLVKTVNIPVIASGGIATLEDIKNLLKIKNLYGAITGKAIYSGSLDLREALRVSQYEVKVGG